MRYPENGWYEENDYTAFASASFHTKNTQKTFRGLPRLQSGTIFQFLWHNPAYHIYIIYVCMYIVCVCESFTVTLYMNLWRVPELSWLRKVEVPLADSNCLTWRQTRILAKVHWHCIAGKEDAFCFTVRILASCHNNVFRFRSKIVTSLRLSLSPFWSLLVNLRKTQHTQFPAT